MHSAVLSTKMLVFTKTVIFQWRSPFHVLEAPTPYVLSMALRSGTRPCLRMTSLFQNPILLFSYRNWSGTPTLIKYSYKTSVQCIITHTDAVIATRTTWDTKQNLVASPTEHVEKREVVWMTGSKNCPWVHASIPIREKKSISNPLLPLRLTGLQLRGRKRISRNQTPDNFEEYSYNYTLL